MDKTAILNFLAWLEDATAEELEVRRKAIEQAHLRVSTREGKADLNLAARLLDEEVLARLQLNQAVHGRD